MNLPASETPPSEPHVRHVTEHIFRREYGKLTAIVTVLYGAHRLQLAEDVVQESLIRALRTWPYSGVPENPTAWLLRTAKNLALDHLRREQNFLRKQPEIVAGIEESGVVSDDESGLSDDRLRLIFVCCHPALPTEVRAALADLDERLTGHHLYHAVLGEFHWQNGDPRTASTHLRRALELTETRPEPTHLAQRLEDCLADCPE